MGAGETGGGAEVREGCGGEFGARGGGRRKSPVLTLLNGYVALD